jgi:hypothetical protein
MRSGLSRMKYNYHKLTFYLQLLLVSRGILLLIFPPLKTGRATFTASGFQKSRGCQVVNLLVAVEMKVF